MVDGLLVFQGKTRRHKKAFLPGERVIVFGDDLLKLVLENLRDNAIDIRVIIVKGVAVDFTGNHKLFDCNFVQRAFV